jgi:hypothetical protein
MVILIICCFHPNYFDLYGLVYSSVEIVEL